MKRWKDDGIKLLVTTAEDHLFVHLLEVPFRLRRRGYGTEVLDELKQVADYENLPIRLEVNPLRNTPKKDVEAFYRTNGFKPHTGNIWEYRLIEDPTVWL